MIWATRFPVVKRALRVKAFRCTDAQLCCCTEAVMSQIKTQAQSDRHSGVSISGGIVLDSSSTEKL